MTKEVKNVPDLRFPGFENTWETKKLHQIVDVKDGTHESPKPTDDGYLLVTSKNLKNSTLDFSESYSISKEDYEDINKRSKVEIGDILFGMIGTIGNPILLEKDGFAIKNVALLKTSSLQEREYILNFLKSNSITKQFYKLNVGGTQKFISLRSIRDLKIDIPSSEEAIKIGGFFNKLDRQIELEEKKLAKLEEQKKGYMQKLFSQELRFKDQDGNDYPKWEKKFIKDIFIFENNRRKQITSSLREKGLYPYYGATGIIDYVKDYLFNNEERLLIGEDGAKWGKFEKSSFIANGQYWVNNHAHVVKSNNHNLYFMNYYLNFKELRTFVTGNAPAKLTHENLCNINLEIPCLNEQGKISALLKSIDNKMNNQINKIVLLKRRKQGLLQKMFV